MGEFLHVGIGKHLFGVIDVVARLDILASLGGERALVGVLLRQAVVFLLVGQDRRIAHLLLQFLVGLDDLLELVAHGGLLHRRSFALSFGFA